MQYRPAQLRTKNIHGILTMFRFALTCQRQYFHTVSGIKSLMPRVRLQVQSVICYQMDRIIQIASSSKQPLLQKYDIQQLRSIRNVTNNQAREWMSFKKWCAPYMDKYFDNCCRKKLSGLNDDSTDRNNNNISD